MTVPANVITEAELAAVFEITEPRAAELRRRNGWPHMRLGRFDIRYTDDQVKTIIRQHSVEGDSTLRLAAATGLTKRSAGRAS